MLRNRLNIKRTPSFGFICSEIYYYITQISTSMKSRAYKTLLAVYEHYAQTENLFAIKLSPSHRFHLGPRMPAKLRKINTKLITLRRFRSNADTIPQIIYEFIHFDTNRNSQTSFLTKRVTTIIYYSESVFDLSI